MLLNQNYSSPNFDSTPIPVEFLVLHYTAGDLERTLDLFMDPGQEVSSHLVIDASGEVYELVPCWDGTVQRAWHAGRSHWMDGPKRWEAFNNFSIGIEIVNLNGNFFPYTNAQYTALHHVTGFLQGIYPALNSPERVIGHEQIAGWRGKVDPGICFDWGWYYDQNYPGEPHPDRKPAFNPILIESFGRYIKAGPSAEDNPASYWHNLSQAMETIHRLSQAKDPDH